MKPQIDKEIIEKIEAITNKMNVILVGGSLQLSGTYEQWGRLTYYTTFFQGAEISLQNGEYQGRILDTFGSVKHPGIGDITKKKKLFREAVLDPKKMKFVKLD